MIGTPIHWISFSLPGRLGLMARPRGGDWLEDEIRSLRDNGVGILVSTLTDLEIEELDLSREEEFASSHAIDYRRFPIPDRAIPSLTAALDFLKSIYADLCDERYVVIHCRQGIGRSGILCAGLLIFAGQDPASALLKIQEARGCPVPDTREQHAWVHAFAAHLKTELE